MKKDLYLDIEDLIGLSQDDKALITLYLYMLYEKDFPYKKILSIKAYEDGDSVMVTYKNIDKNGNSFFNNEKEEYVDFYSIEDILTEY